MREGVGLGGFFDIFRSGTRYLKKWRLPTRRSRRDLHVGGIFCKSTQKNAPENTREIGKVTFRNSQVNFGAFPGWIYKPAVWIYKPAVWIYKPAAEATVGKYGKIAKLPREVQISYEFACVFATFAASPAPIMEAAFGRVHKGGRPSAGLLVGSIIGAGEAANVAKTSKSI